ncbi:MAG: cytochrome c oxidase subunit II, partial [Planctomycetota bacterium]
MLGIPLLLQADKSFWMPTQASTTAKEVDFAFSFIFWISFFFFTLIVGLMLLFIIKYRRRKGYEPKPTAHSHLGIELVWTAIPFVVVIAIFWVAFDAFVKMRTPPENAYEIQVVGQKWSWVFEYPNGWVDNELHVPVDKAVRLNMRSEDVIHSFFVPEFRVKMDVVPGRYTQLWFNAIRTGQYEVRCAELCGTGHSDMLAKLVVHEPGGFEKWLKEAASLLSPLLRQGDLTDPVAFGQKLKDSTAPVHVWFRESLTDPAKQALDAWDGATPPTDEMKQALREALNELLKGECIYEPARFEGVALSKETTELLQKNPGGEELLELNRWLLSESFPGSVSRGPDLVMAGEWVFKRKGGCTSCHSIDGSANTGPTVKGIFGHEQALKDGSKVKVDENYIRESIIAPAAKIAAGYDPVMPTYKGRFTDREIDAIIAYIKSLAE